MQCVSGYSAFNCIEFNLIFTPFDAYVIGSYDTNRLQLMFAEIFFVLVSSLMLSMLSALSAYINCNICGMPPRYNTIHYKRTNTLKTLHLALTEQINTIKIKP